MAPCASKAAAISNAGESLKSLVLGLNDKPKNPIVFPERDPTASWIFSTIRCFCRSFVWVVARVICMGQLTVSPR